MKPLIAYLIIINAIGLILMLLDKYKAKKKLWRIPEAALLGTAAIGGSIGVMVGIHWARHKTRHPQFSVGVPLILGIQLILAFFLIPKLI